MKTITLCDKEENPLWSILKGHHGACVYNKAFKAEGWSGDWIHKDSLRHEYWKQLKNGYWKKSIISDKKAVAVTVSDW